MKKTETQLLCCRAKRRPDDGNASRVSIVSEDDDVPDLEESSSSSSATRSVVSLSLGKLLLRLILRVGVALCRRFERRGERAGGGNKSQTISTISAAAIKCGVLVYFAVNSTCSSERRLACTWVLAQVYEEVTISAIVISLVQFSSLL